MNIDFSFGVRTDSFSSVYPALNHHILNFGSKRNSRNGVVNEIMDFKTQLTNPYRRCVGGCCRDINIFFLLAEAMWIAAGRNDVEFLSIFNERMRDFSDDGVVFHAPYGWRLRHWGVPTESSMFIKKDGFDQVANAIRILSRDPDSRQVVMSIWNPDIDLGYKTKDLPCNDMVMLKIRDGRLITTIANRSNDLHWGLPTNIFQFSFLTELMSLALGVKLGTQTHNSQSLHVYEWNEIAKTMERCFTSGDVFNLYSDSVGGSERYIDFKFDHDVSVNRLREIDNVLNIIINNILYIHRGGVENEDEIMIVKDSSFYLYDVYQYLKIYIYYKMNLQSSENKNALRIDCLSKISSIAPHNALCFGKTWDVSILAKNFFVKRIGDKVNFEYLGKL